MNNSNKLGLFDLTIIVVSLVIGMGIFKTPAGIAAKSGTETIFYSAWLIGGLIAMLGAFVFAEIGARLPVVGAYYKVFSYAYHPAVGFTVNTLILISNAASLAVVTLIGAEYCSHMLFDKQMGFAFNVTLSIVAVGIFFFVNLMGLKTSSRTQNILMIVKVGLILLLIAAMFTGQQVTPTDYSTDPIRTYTGDNGLLLLVISMVAVSFTYGGYQQTINFGGEVSKQGTLQKGIFIGIIIIILLYLTVNYAYVQVIGYDNMKNATSIGSLLFQALFGKVGGKVFDFAMFISVLAYVNILLMSNPRVMYAMSKDGVLPKIFSYQHSKTQALVPGLITFSVITVAVTFFGKGVDNILGFSIFLDSMGFITCALALLILRYRKVNDELVQPGFISKIIPTIAVVFMLAYGVVATAVVLDNWKAALTGVGLLLLFVAVYFVFIQKSKTDV
ncbi:APC family permease [Phnomibacter ginsenosidimutans]|uniref:Amino acid permease n=1 Tax=Phnomibacter ginsenosidimutans TaxID=2676868 RepID=A0A6I6GP68_9BACT|nr:APC family permease [Phnomibacter ginsenosidimutans]QGW29458.1 amino acid permease [Phnomibacter ginsenosidimutans]